MTRHIATPSATDLFCYQGYIFFYHADFSKVLLGNESANYSFKGLDYSEWG